VNSNPWLAVAVRAWQLGFELAARGPRLWSTVWTTMTTYPGARAPHGVVPAAAERPIRLRVVE
jgi:hypothetical protein